MITQDRSSSFVGAALLIAITALAASLPSYFNLKTHSPARYQATLQADRYVTLVDYEQIRVGLTTGQVSLLLGRSGQEISRIELPGMPVTALYLWQNPDGTSLNVTFEDGTAVAKSHSGLR